MSGSVPSTADPLDPAWTRPAAGPREHRVDAITAAALFVGAVLSMSLYRLSGVYNDPAEVWISLVWAVGLTAPLAWRRRWPGPAGLVVGAAFIVGQVLMVPELLFNNIALFLAIYSIGAWQRDRRHATIFRVVIIIAMLTWLIISMFMTATDPDAVPDISRAPGALSPLTAFLLIQILTNVLYFGSSFFFGDRAYASARQRAEIGLRTAELEQERDRTAAQAVALERLRIARELHDVVAHHVSMMGVQAGAARTVLDKDPSTARDALANIELNARNAIDEMHQLLGTLREADGHADPDGTTKSAPSTVGLSGLPDLVTDSIAAGLPATCEVVGESRSVSSVVAVSAYRIVQEALTNARKHAGPEATADVRLRYLTDAIEVEVSNTGSVPNRRSANGMGQRGIRERVAAVGGQVELRPRDRGGYLVRAFLPTPRAATAGPDAAIEEGNRQTDPPAPARQADPAAEGTR